MYSTGEPLFDLSANGPVQPYLGAHEPPTNAATDFSTATPEGETSLESGRENRAGGRPTIFTEAKRAEICAMLAAGCTFKAAARYVGCSPSAISMLSQRDATFRQQVDRAIAEREIIPLSHLRESSKRSWRAAAWLLERTVKGTYRPGSAEDPLDFGRAVEVEVREHVSEKVAELDVGNSPHDLAADIEV